MVVPHDGQKRIPALSGVPQMPQNTGGGYGWDMAPTIAEARAKGADAGPSMRDRLVPTKETT